MNAVSTFRLHDSSGEGGIICLIVKAARQSANAAPKNKAAAAWKS